MGKSPDRALEPLSDRQLESTHLRRGRMALMYGFGAAVIGIGDLKLVEMTLQLYARDRSVPSVLPIMEFSVAPLAALWATEAYRNFVGTYATSNEIFLRRVINSGAIFKRSLAGVQIIPHEIAQGAPRPSSSLKKVFSAPIRMLSGN